jgi:C4-dicarboxylate-specific signal transduction histidine kinase
VYASRAAEALRASQEGLAAQNAALARANRIARQLTASIAHEINQPIATTVANAHAALRWLDRRPPHLEEVRQALARIVKDGHRGGDVIHRIRALTTTGPPEKDCLEINGAIREVIELTRREAAKNGVSVQAELADGLPIIQGDRVQQQEVILNLIINAIEAMTGIDARARELRISTAEAASGGVLVAAKDSGAGLAPATLEHLFDAFYTTKPGRLGLGLSAVRSSKRMADDCGRARTCPAVPPFNSPCRLIRKLSPVVPRLHEVTLRGRRVQCSPLRGGM